ncbi:MAG TPA: hypothetical protein VFY32_10395 [Solirubrobacteraceae bacterium]|nr:hypothetical protein [Solirubrobacteraceae bacterium]
MRTALTDLLGLDVPIVHRPFAVNRTRRPFSEEAFTVGLEAQPAVVSLAIGEPGDLPARAHDAGQTVGLIDAVVPVREVVDEMVAGAGAALAAVSAATSRG